MSRTAMGFSALSCV